MSNPVITAIKSGSAPKPARLAAARGMLPLAQEDLLEALVVLCQDPENEVRVAAQETLNGVNTSTFLLVAQNEQTSEQLLGFLAGWEKSPQDVLEAVILNNS